MYIIVKDGCRQGYGYVRDYVGNIWYYGTIKECKQFIKAIEGSLKDGNIL